MDDDDPATPKKPTPRKVSSTNKRTPIRKTSNNNTPGRKISTPNSAPVRKITSAKKAEPTLFQDFLLGRPSPQRKGTANGRRKSLDVVKKEIRLAQEEVAKVQSPGGVKDRVKQWQKASAAAIVVTPVPVNGEEASTPKVDEGDRIRNSQKRPGRRKSKEAEDATGSGGKDAANTAAKVAMGRERSKSAAAPKKRVISDDHWMKRSPAKKTPAGPARIPKDFLERTAINPPVERKIDDWMKRTAGDHQPEDIPPPCKKVSPESTPRRRNVSRVEDDDQTPTRRKTPRQTASGNTELEDTPRPRKPSRRDLADDGIRIRASPDDGVRVRPSRIVQDDGIRVMPSRDNSFNAGDDSIQIKPTRRQRQPKEDNPPEFRTSSARSENHLRPQGPDASYTVASQQDDEEPSSLATPTRTESKRRPRRSGSLTDSSMSEIPFGNSAFSVLELPVGAEANTLRRPIPPKRNPSFVVPKVLKRVYTEGMKIVHDTVDPPRVGVNHPPSIESWLNGTTDPFVDRPATPSTLGTAEPPSRVPSYKAGDRTERELMEGSDRDRIRRRKRAQTVNDLGGVEVRPDHDILAAAKARETLPSMENSPLTSPAGLRRTPATRITASPKSGRKVPLKEALLDAFRGESTTYRVKGNPLADLSGYRDNRSPPELMFEDHDNAKSDDSTPKASPAVPKHSSVELPTGERPLPAFPRRQAPTTGEHRLSTIISVETFRTSSSLSDSASDISRTTVTQSNVSKSTVFTAPTASTLSQNSNKSGLKRRLTKHSDLVSLLSLPDGGAPGRTKSIRSARSVRTNRSPLETATIQDLMRELADDETKYMRELKTLVDGVIPVLLTCVLSKSESAVAAGLFDNSREGLDPSFTKPIVDMGIALERLKSLHNRIPLNDPKAFVTWLQGAQKSYDDYLTAWRMGFQDVVVNLAPGSQAESPTLDEIPRNANGDVIGSNGARVDVAFLLKRPLVRIKYLEKILKGILKHEPSAQHKDAHASWEELQKRVRIRVNEEKARLEDRTANNTDTTRARDPETLALAEDVKIDQTRQVYFKDDFSLDLSHSTGQRIECEIELIIRDKPSAKDDAGDVLIVASDGDEVKKWLLFPPIEKQYISSRIGDHPTEVIIMIRDRTRKWHECLLLKTDDHEAANELVDIFGSVPLPPKIIHDDASVVSKLTESILGAKTTAVGPNKENLEAPIGGRSRSIIDKERARRQAEEESSIKKHRRQSSARAAPSVLTEKSDVSITSPKDLNEAMKKAGSPGFTAMKHARARYHSRDSSVSSTPRAHADGTVDHQLLTPPGYDCVVDDPKSKSPSKHEYYMVGGLSNATTPTRQSGPSSPAASPKLNTPLKEYMRPEANVLKKQQPPTTTRGEEPPPPPAHRAPTTPNTLKKAAPVLDPSTPQSKNRRTSSPLKHEYQPSIASETSSSSEASDSEDGSYSDSSDDDELEAAEIPEPPPSFQYPKRPSPPVSLYNLPSGSVAPSNSASQAPSRSVPTMPSTGNVPKLVAFISAWDDKHGRWLDLHNGPCSIVVSPGKIEAFEMSAAHSSPRRDLSAPDHGREDEIRPLIEQGLTPHVNLRRGVAVDLNITSRPTTNSLLQVQGTNVIRYRTNTVPDNILLYNLVHKARLENPIFKQLELDRHLSGFGQKNVYEDAVAPNRRRSFLGRKNSYRASVRAPATSVSDEQSMTSSTVSRLRRLSGSVFNIGKSTIQNVPASQYTSSSNSTFSGPTPPRTPTSPSLAGTSTTNGGGVANKYSTENLKIRLYNLATRSSWDDRGAARITITAPPPGMRQRSTINQGITRRIVVTQEIKSPGSKEKVETVVIDEILGADCFGRIGRSGVLCQIWEEMRGDNGEVGTVGKVGGVSGRTRKWCFQTKGEADADWIFGLCCVKVAQAPPMAGSLSPSVPIVLR